ncbi:hypothetical protein [Streptosporangium canum]|uniref:hypothetical protein n=1 Tax=Streptosporangium canum TaxID=324952 RepID=UPI00116029C5|nr:hypothetical protein [Streptosporangium canum]
MVDWAWKDLNVLNGNASSVPPLLSALLHGAFEEREHAFRALCTRVVNQGDLYSSAAAVTDVILKELNAGLKISENAWLLLHEIFRGSSYGRTVMIGSCEWSIDEYCRSRILDSIELIDGLIEDLSDEEFSYAMLLLGSMGEFTNSVMPIMERESCTPKEGRRVAACNALEVARELWCESHEGSDGNLVDQ